MSAKKKTGPPLDRVLAYENYLMNLEAQSRALRALRDLEEVGQKAWEWYNTALDDLAVSIEGNAKILSARFQDLPLQKGGAR